MFFTSYRLTQTKKCPVRWIRPGGAQAEQRGVCSCAEYSTGTAELQIIIFAECGNLFPVRNGGKNMTFEEVALMLWARQNHLEIVSVRFVPKEEGKQEEQKK